MHRVMNYRKLLQLPQNCARHLFNHQLSWLGLAASLPLFGMVTAFAVAPGTATPPAVSQQLITQQLALPTFNFSQSDTRYWRHETVRRGDSIARVLNRLGISDTDARHFQANSTLSRELLRLQPGATLAVETNDAGALFSLQFLHDDENGEKILVLARQRDGRWQASADPAATETMDSLHALTIRHDALAELKAAGLGPDIIAQLADIFADRVNLAELQAGDSIALVHESLLHAGSPIANGNIMAAHIRQRGKIHQAFRFAHDSESGSYYDANGMALKQGLAMAPLSNPRISSGFGTRYHPLLHSIRQHQGIDYAAASGTPVRAPAVGTIVSIDTQNGYGKVLTLRHNAKLTTLYAHLQRFAPGIRAGQQVQAGQLLAYVGNTGRSTGPHLHFETRLNGLAVDPATAILPAPALAGRQKADFIASSRQWQAKLALLQATPANIAQLDS